MIEMNNTTQEAVSMMHPELILENIRIQIDADLINPYKVNYLKDYIYQYKYLCKEYEGDIDTLNVLNNSLIDTLNMVIDKISDKFNFRLDIDNDKHIKTIAKSLYKFFVIKYEKNIIEFISNYILKNKKTIINTVKSTRGTIKKSKNVTSLANKMLYSPNEAIIISNINFIVTEIIPSLDLGVSYLEYLSSNNATLNIIKDLFYGHNISLEEDPYEMFILPIAEKHSGYGTIISEVTVNLANIYNKKDDIALIDYEGNDEEE